jgi:flavin reductase (DIM6/NTAB) family NADH-FMN oxidoreductase RutF
MYEEIIYHTRIEEMLQQLPHGAFLSVRADDKINTMTIGWGAIGFFWARPVMIVGVRHSRYTYNLMEKARDFSVSVPLNAEFKKSLAGAGSKSGRDVDKFQVFNLKADNGQRIESPVIGSCGLIYECKLIYKQDMDPAMLDEELKKKYYPQDDYHVIYWGEIVSTYINE